MSSVAPILVDLFRRPIVEAAYDQAGVLQVRAEGDTAIVVEPDPMYEAWTYAGESGYLVVCEPEGEVTTFRKI
jgi:hypothetical protein